MTLTPTRLWKQMTAEQRRRAAAALWDADKADAWWVEASRANAGFATT